MSRSGGGASNWQPQASLEQLRKRSDTLRAIRAFFYERGYLEVETPKLSGYAAVDRHINSIPANTTGKNSYLITSPEYHMKRLIASGSGSIFQLGRVFRQGEVGQRHNPEFTMLEWYRIGCSEEEFLEEIEELVCELLPCRRPFGRTPYAQAIQQHTGIAPHALTHAKLCKLCEQNDSPAPQGLEESSPKDDLLDYLMSFFVEGKLGQSSPEFITDYPASQSALARIKESGCAARFELYYQGMELCNGFHELQDADEQYARFERENAARHQAGKDTLAIDHRFIAALEAGLPDSCGVALGIDRLLMLQSGAQEIGDVLAFPFDRA